MIKKAIKLFLYRIYLIGFNENKIRIEKSERLALKENAIIPESVITSATTRIFNHRFNPEKIKIGENSIVLGQFITFQHGGEIEIGEWGFIGEGSTICSASKIKIGNRVLISHNVNIYDNISHSLDSKVRHDEFVYIYNNHIPMPLSSLSSEDIVIGDDVWIGFNVTILKGVKIGNRAIIGANTLITKDVPEGVVVVGHEQKIIRTIN